MNIMLNKKNPICTLFVFLQKLVYLQKKNLLLLMTILKQEESLKSGPILNMQK